MAYSNNLGGSTLTFDANVGIGIYRHYRSLFSGHISRVQVVGGFDRPGIDIAHIGNTGRRVSRPFPGEQI
jgi:hypothetical protein